MSDRQLNVLVLDDDASITRFVSRCLAAELGERLQIETSNDPQGAKQRLQAGECDLLISDFEMPGADGIEMLRFAKSYNAWTQVVLMTAHSTWDRVYKAIELGASDYLLKPLRRDDLVCVVEVEVARVARWRTAVVDSLKLTSASGV